MDREQAAAAARGLWAALTRAALAIEVITMEAVHGLAAKAPAPAEHPPLPPKPKRVVHTDDFHQHVRELVLALGGRETFDGKMPEWQIFDFETKAGELRVTLTRRDRYKIFGRFAQPGRAAQVLTGDALLHLNDVSGKWNFTWSEGDPGPQAIEQFRRCLVPLL